MSSLKPKPPLKIPLALVDSRRQIFFPLSLS